MAWLNWLKKYSLLILILIFGLFLYTYKLDTIPPAVYSDEAIVGVNALSILETGLDEYGQPYPIYFKFFSSFTPGLFVYSQVLPVYFLGLNPFSIRILSVISMLIIALILGIKFGSLTSLFFIITPWTIFNARLGYETTFAFCLISLGILFYKRPTLSFFLISLSTYACHTERYLAPLLIILIHLVFYRKKILFKSLFPALIIQIPNIILLFTPAFWVKNTSFTSSFFSQYTSYFSPQNLFNLTDYQLQRSIPQLSVFYFWMFIPWIAGFYIIYKNIKKPFYQYLLGLIIILPIPAALANTNYSTQRALPLLLPYTIITVLGYQYLTKKLSVIFKVTILFILLAYSAIFFYRSYFILFPKERAQAWDYGYQQLAEYIISQPEKHFVVDNARSVPYSLLLFYLKPSMKKYQQDNSTSTQNYYSNTQFNGVAKINNIDVRPIIWQKDIYQSQIIVSDYLGISEDQIKEHYLIKVFEVKNNQGKIILHAYKTNPVKKCESNRSKICQVDEYQYIPTN